MPKTANPIAYAKLATTGISNASGIPFLGTQSTHAVYSQITCLCGNRSEQVHISLWLLNILIVRRLSAIRST